MLTLFNRYATPLTTGLFLVSLISGLLLFFHVGPGGVHGIHEILSLVLIVPFALHLWRNWRPFLNYFKHAPMAIALVASIVMSVPFLLPSDSAGGNDRAALFGLIQTVMAGTPAEVAPLLHVTPDALVGKLTAAGFATATADQPLSAIATASGKSESDLAAVLTTASAEEIALN